MRSSATNVTNRFVVFVESQGSFVKSKALFNGFYLWYTIDIVQAF